MGDAFPDTMPDAVRTLEVVTGDAHIGRYRILRHLETNETSEMVLAVTEGALGFERAVIIKRLLPHAHSDPNRARSFGQEASAYARLTHPAVVRLYDYITVDEMPAMVLEHVDGVSLKDLLDELRARGERLPIEAALYVGARVFAALSAAHAARDPVTRARSPVIHRDVSPGNVLLGGDGEVKLSNFGFAKLVGTAPTELSMEIPKGTLGYMAPEQLLGEPVTLRTDVYGGALLVRELLTGDAAFARGDEPYVEYLEAMAKPSLAPVSTVCPRVPRVVADALQIALEAESAQRAISAIDMQRVLNSRSKNGRAKLIQVLVRLGLVRQDDVDQADDPSITMPSTFRLESRARRVRLLAVGLAVCAALFAVVVARSGIHAARGSTLPTAIAPAPPAAMRAALSEPPLPSLEPPKEVEPSPPAATLVSATGELRTPGSTPPHRVFVDGRFMGESGTTFTVSCGAHTVRIGGGGEARKVTVPCGGTAAVATR